MTTLPTSPPEPDSERLFQSRAFIVAGKLAMYDLPTVHNWSVGYWGLEVQISSRGADAVVMADLHTWATHLGDGDGPLHIHTEPYKHTPARMEIYVKTVRDGVPVRVWTAVDTPADDDAAKGGASNG